MGDIVISEVAKDLIINIVNIIVLFLIIKALVYKPVKKFLDDRTAAKAKEQQAQIENTAKEGERIIADARTQADGIVSEAEEKAREKAERITARAQAEVAEQKNKALADIKEEREEFIESAREDIAGLAVGISEKILCREVSEADNRKIVDDFFAEKGDRA